MDIKKLYESLLNEFFYDDNSNGELILLGNCIIWKYKNINNTYDNEFDYLLSDYINDEEEDIIDLGLTIKTNDELLYEKYDEMKNLMELYISQIDNIEHWSFSNPDIIDNYITFKIF